MQISSQQTRSKIGVVLWCICKDRNSRLLDETNIPLATAISLATQHFSQWSQVQARASPQIHSDTSQNIAWNPPQQNFSGSKLLWSWSLFEEKRFLQLVLYLLRKPKHGIFPSLYHLAYNRTQHINKIKCNYANIHAQN